MGVSQPPGFNSHVTASFHNRFVSQCRSLVWEFPCTKGRSTSLYLLWFQLWALKTKGNKMRKLEDVKVDSCWEKNAISLFIPTLQNAANQNTRNSKAVVYSTVFHAPNLPIVRCIYIYSTDLCRSPCLLWHAIKQLFNAFSWLTMKYPTCHLTVLSW